MSTCFEGGKEDFSSSKGDAAGILSEFRHRGISTSGFLEDGFSWNRVLSHGWIHVVSKEFLSRTS